MKNDGASDVAKASRNGRKRRRLRNLIIAPERQARILYLSSAGAMTTVVVLFGVILFRINQVLDTLTLLARDPALALDTAENVKLILWQSFGIMVVTIIGYTFGLIIKVTHAFLGPVVAIQRHVDALREGRFTSRVKLRENDQLTELADGLNSLAEHLERRGSATDQRGFTLIEVLIGLGAALGMILTIGALQTNLSVENRALGQKLEFTDFGRLATQLLADDNVCTCNTKNLPVSTAPDGTTVANFDWPATLHAGYGALCTPPGAVLAQQGENLANTRYQIPIGKIQITDLTALPPDPVSTAMHLTVYQGSITISAFDDPGAATKSLVRALAPVKIAKKFYVSGGHITACGQSVAEISYAYDDAWQSNGALTDTVSTAVCPAGSLAIGGGWITNPGAGLAADCPFRYAAAMSSYPTSGSWNVILRCQTFKAFASCYRPVH